MSKVTGKLKKARQVMRDRGLAGVGIVALEKVEKKQRQTTKTSVRKTQITFLAKHEDVLKANWSANPYKPKKQNKKPPYTINWVMSPPRSGGGHQNIFRFIHYLEQQGHTCNVYLYSTSDFADIKVLQKGMRLSYPETTAAKTMQWLDGTMGEADAVFATGWETAYPVFNDQSEARKFYFVQDFEPYFYPVGSEYILAENTYKFNFFGITAGGWLSEKLSKDYGMKCSNYDFGADTSLYRCENTSERKEIFFYARPVTTRRGFELGIMALEQFHKKHPEYKITLAGWDVSDYHIPFPYENLKTLSLEELSDVYNRSAAALVISLTNMSLLPLELLACGTIPVLNDGENNRKVSNNKYIKYAQASPEALAEALSETVLGPDLPGYAQKAAESVAGAAWEKSGRKFEQILEKELRG